MKLREEEGKIYCRCECCEGEYYVDWHKRGIESFKICYSCSIGNHSQSCADELGEPIDIEPVEHKYPFHIRRMRNPVLRGLAKLKYKIKNSSLSLFIFKEEAE